MARAGYGECVVRSQIGGAQWARSVPTPAMVRPRHCVRCGEAAFSGAKLRVVSHGFRRRTELGPGQATGSAEGRTQLARRFLCAADGCGAVMLVVPASIAPRLHYSSCAIALALALWAKVDGEGTRPARMAAAPGSAQAAGTAPWRQPRRWATAAARRRIFPSLSRVPDLIASPLEKAVQVVQCLAGWAPRSVLHTSLSSQAFAGAEQLA